MLRECTTTCDGCTVMRTPCNWKGFSTFTVTDPSAFMDTAVARAPLGTNRFPLTVMFLVTMTLASTTTNVLEAILVV